MAIPAAPESLTGNSDVLIQTLTWIILVMMLTLATVTVAGGKALKWLLSRCDIRTDAAWLKVEGLTAAINQSNALEKDRQTRINAGGSKG